MKKIAFVNHRYGLEVTGGSELECRLLAEHLQEFYDVEVLTTCAIDDGTWSNHYQEGEHRISGVKVKRFPTAKNRDWTKYDDLNWMISDNNNHVYDEEVQWIMDQGPYSPELFDYLHLYYEQYDVIIFMTYLYYTSAICMLGIPNALFIPTAHDEAAIYLPHYKRVFSEPLGYFYNTPEEKEFIEKKFPIVKSKPNTTGVFGIDIPEYSMLPDIRVKFDLPEDYILYAGRIAEAKGCDVLINNFLKYKQNNRNGLKLLLIGKMDMCVPDNEDIVFLGFVSEEEKLALMRHARIFVIASHFESLSIVVLEAFSVETPVLVIDACKVLRGHVIRSGAGLCFKSYEDFEDALNGLYSEPEEYLKMGKKGKAYVSEYYTWDAIISSMRTVIEQVNFSAKEVESEEQHVEVIYNRKIEPTFKNKEIPIIWSSDNNYASVLAVSLQSIISNSSEENNYDILILSDRINEVNRNMLHYMVKDKPNVTLRFVEVSNHLDKYNFKFNNTQLSRATFMRLLIPDLFDAYEKVLYLDCDTVALRDIAEMYNINIGTNIIGAVRDAHVIEVQKFRKHIENHIIKDIQLNDPKNYFNAGVLLINVKELKHEYTSEKLLQIATSRKWLWEDQDVLNYISRGRVFYLDQNWNVFWVECPKVQQLMLTNVEYTKALKYPKLIHYLSGSMPINRPNERYSYYYWNYAKKTPFYELLLLSTTSKFISPQLKNVNIPNNTALIKDNVFMRKVKGLFRNLRERGFVYTFKLVIIYIKSLFISKSSQRHAYIDAYVENMKNKL